MLDEGVRLKRDAMPPNDPNSSRDGAGASAGMPSYPTDLLPFTYWNISKLALITILGGMIGLMAGIIWMRTTTPAYTATMVVGPTAQLGLAGMGFRMPTTAAPTSELRGEQHAEERVSDFEHFRRLLTSPQVAGLISTEEPFMQKLVSDRWRGDAKRWDRPDTDHDQRLTNWLRGTATPTVSWQAEANTKPARFATVYGDDGQFFAGWLHPRVAIRRVGETAMYEVSFRHTDRDVALGLLQRLFDRTDRLLRQEAKRRVDIQIEHLNRQMQRTDLASHRQGMAELLARELQTSLMLGVDLPFAADMIESPQALTVADWPAPLPIAGVGILAGGCLAFALGFAWIDRRRRVVS